MTHNVMVPNAIAALNIDSLNRSAVCASELDNGNLVVLASMSATAGESEVWTATVPATGALTQLWMVYESEVNVTDAKYKGLDPDPRNFSIAATKVFSCFKPQLGDIITMTADGLAGSKGSNTFVNATDTTGGLKPVWGATQTSSVFSMKLIDTTYFSIGTGAMDNQRIVAYRFEVVGL